VFNEARNLVCSSKRRQKTLSLKRVLKTLESLGLSEAEAKVYVYLAKVGPSQAKDVSSGLKMTIQQLRPALNSLKKKGIVTCKFETATVFAALPFEGLLNLFMELGVKQQKNIEEIKKRISQQQARHGQVRQ
jgi:sugar-specific transcriptional regulator TrmB